MAGLDCGLQCHSNVAKCRVGTSPLLNQFDTICIELQPLSNAAYENRIQRQKENVPKRAPLHLQPARKRLMAREEGNRASCLEETLKAPLFLEFISIGVTNIYNKHMPLVHYLDQFTP